MNCNKRKKRRFASIKLINSFTGGELIVSGQFYCTISGEALFYSVEKISYLYGFWRFANA